MDLYAAKTGWSNPEYPEKNPVSKPKSRYHIGEKGPAPYEDRALALASNMGDKPYCQKVPALIKQ